MERPDRGAPPPPDPQADAPPDSQADAPPEPVRVPTPQGPVALVTGAAVGVGWGLAERLYADGYRLVATDLDGEGLLRRAAAAGWETGWIRLEQLDVCDPAAWQELLDATIERWGRIDLLINGAGWLEAAWVHEARPEQVDRHLDVNAKGVLLGTCLAAGHMVRQGAGHVVNLATMAGVTPVPGMALYSGSKFAVRGFSLAAAQELRERGVTVTVVCADTVDTDQIMRRAVLRQPLELTLPAGRGLLAKLASAFPARTGPILRRVQARGAPARRALAEPAERAPLGPDAAPPDQPSAPGPESDQRQ